MTAAITLDSASAEQFIKSVPGASIKSFVSAANETRNKAKTITSKEIRKDVRLPHREIVGNKSQGKEGLIAGTKNATQRSPFAKLSARKRGLRLGRFIYGSVGKIGRRGPDDPPIEVKIKPKGGPIAMPSVFALPLRGSGEIGLFIFDPDRLNKGGFKLRRSKIQHLYAPSPSQMFGRELDLIAKVSEPLFVAEFQKDVFRRLEAKASG